MSLTVTMCSRNVRIVERRWLETDWNCEMGNAHKIAVGNYEEKK